MTDPRTITTTLLVNFGQDAQQDDVLLAEVDARPDGLNKGKTSFAPGEDVFVLVYKGANVTIDSVATSAGTLLPQPSLSPQIVDQTEDLTFSNERDARTNRPMNVDGFSVEWIGKSLGTPLLAGESLLRVPEQAADPFIGVARASYKSSALAYRLTNTKLDFEEYPIAIFFKGTAV